jgi:hypothetical protein
VVALLSTIAAEESSIAFFAKSRGRQISTL